MDRWRSLLPYFSLFAGLEGFYFAEWQDGKQSLRLNPLPKRSLSQLFFSPEWLYFHWLQCQLEAELVASFPSLSEPLKELLSHELERLGLARDCFCQGFLCIYKDEEQILRLPGQSLCS